MEHTIPNVLGQLEESGKLHDEAEPEHEKKYLNLEPDTAETVALLLKSILLRDSTRRNG